MSASLGVAQVAAAPVGQHTAKRAASKGRAALPSRPAFTQQAAVAGMAAAGEQRAQLVCLPACCDLWILHTPGTLIRTIHWPCAHGISPCVSPASAERFPTTPYAPHAALLLAPPALAMDLTYAPSSVKAALEQRDEAMAYQCTGGMFDCECAFRGSGWVRWASPNSVSLLKMLASLNACLQGGYCTFWLTKTSWPPVLQVMEIVASLQRSSGRSLWQLRACLSANVRP